MANDNNQPVNQQDLTADSQASPQTNQQPDNENIILDNILSKKKEENKLKSIFVDSGLEEKIRQKARAQSSSGWRFVQISALIAVLTFASFYILLDSKTEFISKVFGPTFPEKARISEEMVLENQTKINEKNLLIAKLNLDKIIYTMDAYNVKKSEFSKKNIAYESSKNNTKLKGEVAALETDVETLKTEIASLLKVVKGKLEANLAPQQVAETWGKTNQDFEQMFKDKLAGYIAQRKISWMQEAGTKGAAPEDVREGIQDLNNILDLLNSSVLKDTLAGIQNLDNLTNEDLNNVLEVINDITKNSFSIVAKLKNERVSWRDVLENIKNVTKSVDQLYGRVDLGLDQIRYNSYQFDADNNQFVLTGNIYRDDGKNFTIIANLIDAFESSKHFKDVKLRSFSKAKGMSETGSDPYVAPLNLTFALQQDGEDDSRDVKPILEENSGEKKAINE